jgi:hypothetical protein
MAYCELCEVDREFCLHGLAEGRSGLWPSPIGW